MDDSLFKIGDPIEIDFIYSDPEEDRQIMACNGGSIKARRTRAFRQDFPSLAVQKMSSKTQGLFDTDEEREKRIMNYTKKISKYYQLF